MKVWFSAIALGLFLNCGCADVDEPAPVPQQQNVQSHASAPSSHSSHTETPAAPVAPPRPTVPQEDGRLVDMQTEMAKNPNIVVIDNKIQGSDPISALGSAYVTQTSRVQALNMQQNLRIMQAEKGRPLNFAEFEGLVKQLNIQCNKLPPYRMFGYDSKTGEISILEDKAMKKTIYEEKGIPWDE